MKTLVSILTMLSLMLLMPRVSWATTAIDPRIGVAHVGGIYPDSGASFLTDGANDAFTLGFRTIEFHLGEGVCWITPTRPQGLYHSLSLCEGVQTMTDMIKKPSYQQAIGLPFQTIFLTADSPNPENARQWGISGEPFTPSQLQKTYDEFYDLASYLLRAYQGTQKTFILQTPNELDWNLLANKGCPACDYNTVEPDATSIQNAISYLNTISDAVVAARTDNSAPGVTVYHACEINLVVKGMGGKKSAVTDVLPSTHCNLYGYSAYEAYLTDDEVLFPQVLDYIAQKAPDSSAFGNKNVYISEAGYPLTHPVIQNDAGAATAATRLLSQAFLWGTPYLLHWQLYDNECTRINPTDSDCPGFWIRKPSGSLASLYTVMQSYAQQESSIQQLIDDLPDSGGEVVLSAGTYVLDTPAGNVEYFPNGSPIPSAIVINKNNVVLRGQGSQTILQLAPHTKMRAISITSSNVTVKDLVIDGNKSERNGSVPWPGGDVVDALLYGNSTAANITIDNVEVRNAIEDGIGFWKSQNVIVKNSYSHDNGTLSAGGAGISLSGVTNGQAFNNRVENNTATGIWSSFDANTITIADNSIANNRSGGITIGGGTLLDGLGPDNSGFTIEKNILSQNGEAGFATLTVFASSNGVLKKNRIDTSFFDSIQVDGTALYFSNHWNIEDNVCPPPSSTDPGVRVLNNANDISLYSNICQANAPQLTPVGDLDKNGKVNSIDFAYFPADFGESGSIGFSSADLNLDGIVDFADFVYIANGYGI